MRLGKPLQAFQLVDGLLLVDAPHELAGEILIVKATALNLLHRYDESAVVALEARVPCISAGFASIEAELLFSTVVGSLLQGDDAAAESAAMEILALEDPSHPWIKSKTYRLSLGYFKSRACDVIGVVERSRSHYDEQAKWLRQALEEFDKAEVRDDFLQAGMLSNFADSALGVGLSDVLADVVERANRIEWSPFLAEYEFRLFSALAEASSSAGDQLGALRFLRRCTSCAPTAALQLRSTVERARIFSEIGEAFSSREELDHAIRLSKSVDWSNVSETDQRQLLFLAAQVAGHSALEARRLLARYDGLKCSLPTSVFMRDDRFRAEELFARSAILRANGENSRAVLALIDALQLFNSVSDSAKAANVAAELAELTHEPHYVAIVREQCEKQPHSILARKMARIDAWMAQPVLA